MPADHDAAGAFLSPTCDFPDCTEKAVGKSGFDWHCRNHRPGRYVPPMPVVVAVATEAPAPVDPKPKQERVYKVPRRKPGKAYNPTIRNPLPLILRADADADPGCRIAGCVVKPMYRGLCDPHARRARKAGLMDALALPNPPGVASLPLVLRDPPVDGACRIAECPFAPHYRGLCHSHRKQLVGRIDEFAAPRRRP